MIAEIQELQAKRVVCLRQLNGIENACRAFIRRELGWSMQSPEKDRDRAKATAAELVKAIGSGGAIAPELAAVAAKVRPVCDNFARSAEPWRGMRDDTESQLRKLARSLPVWPWVESVRGFGDLGLSIIVGEAGDLSNYANPDKLKKRMGVAAPDAYLMECKDGREARAIPRRRRSALWTIGDSLIKGNKSDDGSDGPYRVLYLARKVRELARTDEGKPKVTKTAPALHAHRRAQRVMEQWLLIDLWAAWRAAR